MSKGIAAIVGLDVHDLAQVVIVDRFAVAGQSHDLVFIVIGVETEIHGQGAIEESQ